MPEPLGLGRGDTVERQIVAPATAHGVGQAVNHPFDGVVFQGSDGADGTAAWLAFREHGHDDVDVERLLCLVPLQDLPYQAFGDVVAGLGVAPVGARANEVLILDIDEALSLVDAATIGVMLFSVLSSSLQLKA